MSTTDPRPGATSHQPAGSPDTGEVMQFPMRFPLKIMGRNVDGFTDEIIGIISRHVPDFDASTLETRESRSNTWLSLTATFTATSREQLDALYKELSARPSVSYLL